VETNGAAPDESIACPEYRDNVVRDSVNVDSANEGRAEMLGNGRIKVEMESWIKSKCCLGSVSEHIYNLARFFDPMVPVDQGRNLGSRTVKIMDSQFSGCKGEGNDVTSPWLTGKMDVCFRVEALGESFVVLKLAERYLADHLGTFPGNRVIIVSEGAACYARRTRTSRGTIRLKGGAHEETLRPCYKVSKCLRSQGLGVQRTRQ
jgi:hypothetical protein